VSEILPQESNLMTKKNLLINISFIAALFCSSLMLAQAPVVDIDKKLHPNLAAAQDHLVQATNYIAVAQKDHNYDMQGHAEKARQLLIQANQEIKLAAEAANAAASQRKK
jgi:hypothetical protein